VIVGCTSVVWTAIRGAFRDAIDAYVGLRDEFAVLARLPSDRIVRRRGGGPDSPGRSGAAAPRPAGQEVATAFAQSA
jgi:hypothetical protein